MTKKVLNEKLESVSIIELKAEFRCSCSYSFRTLISKFWVRRPNPKVFPLTRNAREQNRFFFGVKIEIFIQSLGNFLIALFWFA